MLYYIFKTMKKRFGIIGNPIKHSLSPVLHNYWFKKYDIDADYKILEVNDNGLSEIITKIKQGEYTGINVTLPFKQKIINYLDKVNLIDSEDSNIKFEFLGKKEEKEDLFFGLIEIVNSDFKIKFSSEDKEKIVLNYQGCYKNKVCYPIKMRYVFIKYDKESISSVKIN